MTKSAKLSRARDDLASYAVAQWHQFRLAEHHRILIDALEGVERGDFPRLMVFMPPRHGKSLIASTLFPSWYLGKHPDRSIIATSYGAELAQDFGRKVRNFCAVPLHRKIFPICSIADDSSAISRFHTTLGGSYYAVGSGGPLTGRGGDLIIIDDPIKNLADANSATFRRHLQEWYESVLYTRQRVKYSKSGMPYGSGEAYAEEMDRQDALAKRMEPGYLTNQRWSRRWGRNGLW